MRASSRLAVDCKRDKNCRRHTQWHKQTCRACALYRRFRCRRRTYVNYNKVSLESKNK